MAYVRVGELPDLSSIVLDETIHSHLVAQHGTEFALSSYVMTVMIVMIVML